MGQQKLAKGPGLKGSGPRVQVGYGHSVKGVIGRHVSGRQFSGQPQRPGIVYHQVCAREYVVSKRCGAP